MNIKKILMLLLSIIFLFNYISCSQLQKFENIKSFEFVGWSLIPDGLLLYNPVSINDKIYFLESNTDNIVISTISAYMDGQYDLRMLGTYFRIPILKFPISMCSDFNGNLFILETGDKVNDFFEYNGIGVRIVSSDSSFQFPISIKIIFQNDDIKEIIDLRSKINEIKKVKEAKKMIYCNKYLIIMFDNINSLLCINTESINKDNFSYFTFNLPKKPINIDSDEDSFLVLFDDNTIINYKYDFSIRNFIEINEILISTLTETPQIFFLKKENIIMLYESTKDNLIVLKNNHELKLHIKSLRNIYKINVRGSKNIIIVTNYKSKNGYAMYKIN